MNYKILLAALLFFTPAFASEQTPPKPVASCAPQVPFGQPTVKPGSALICRSAYLLSFNPFTKTPDWVSWTLTPEHAIGCVPRVNAFAADASLGASSPRPEDTDGGRRSGTQTESMDRSAAWCSGKSWRWSRSGGGNRGEPRLPTGSGSPAAAAC